MNQIPNKYANEFLEVKLIGHGGFSYVYEASSKRNNVNYAIKKIPFDLTLNDRALNEIQFLQTLDNKYVVRYFDSWVEENYYNQVNDGNLVNNRLLLHIQMELCIKTLSDVIKEVVYPNKNYITTDRYRYLCGLLNQLIEAVQYLHSSEISTIHRDLKPQNILLTLGPNGLLVKLSDFGSSTRNNIENDTQSHTAYTGTNLYRAPEVASGAYNNKADIFSLGVIVQQLFNIDLNDDSHPNYQEMEKIRLQYENLKMLSIKCSSIKSQDRPSCEQILKNKENWNYIEKNNSRGLLSTLNNYGGFNAIGSIALLVGVSFILLKGKNQ